MKYFVILLAFTLTISALARSGRGKRFAIEPELGFQFSKWSQAVNSTPLEGTMGGNANGFRYGANLHYHLSTRLTTGYGFKADQLNWTYADSKDYSTDNDWPEFSKAKELSHTLFLGLRFNRFILIAQYIFDSRLTFDDYFVEDLGKAKFEGTGYGLKLQLPIGRRFFWGVTLRQLTYNKATIAGDSSDLPGTFSGMDFKEKKVQSVIVDVSFPIGFL